MKTFMILALGLMTMGLSSNSWGMNLVWQCQSNLYKIEVYSQEAIKADGFGVLRFQENQILTVKAIYSDVEQSFEAKVVSQKFAGLAKHAAIAWYVLEPPGWAAPLTLALMGIDEFENRQRCKWGL